MSAGAEAMRCQEFVEVVTDYLERQLTEAEMSLTDEHLAGCEACRAYLDQMRETVAALRSLAEQGVGEQQLTRALEAFRAAHA